VSRERGGEKKKELDLFFFFFFVFSLSLPSLLSSSVPPRASDVTTNQPKKER